MFNWGALMTVDEKPEQDDGADIVVNGNPMHVDSRIVSFSQVTQLAFPDSTAEHTFTVLFYKTDQSRQEGSMLEGDSVKVHKHGSSFNVTRSIRS